MDLLYFIMIFSINVYKNETNVTSISYLYIYKRFSIRKKNEQKNQG